MFNWGTTWPRLSRLADSGFLQRTRVGRQKYDYDIGEAQWRRIVSESAKSTRGLVPSLPLNEVRALIASKSGSRIKIAEVDFDLVGYDENLHRIVRGPMEFRPGPVDKPDVRTEREKWFGLLRQARELPLTTQSPETIVRVSVPLPRPIPLSMEPPLVDLSVATNADSPAKEQRKISQSDLLVPWCSPNSFDTVVDDVKRNSWTHTYRYLGPIVALPDWFR